MAVFFWQNKRFYIDNRLKNQLDTKIFPELKSKDKDCVFIVDGKERSGKSKFSDILGAYASLMLESYYGLKNVCMTPDEFRNAIEKSNKNDIIIYDEAHRGMGSRRALSEINNMLVDMMMEMGQKNLLIIIVLPTFFMLDKYQALFRARGLFHMYEGKKKLKSGKKIRERGYWVYFNEAKKKTLYLKGKKLLDYNCMKWPRFRGRFLNQYAVDEKAYRLKKKLSFEKKPRSIRSEKQLEQRNQLIYLLYKSLNLKVSELIAYFQERNIDIKRDVVDRIIMNKEKPPKNT